MYSVTISTLKIVRRCPFHCQSNVFSALHNFNRSDPDQKLEKKTPTDFYQTEFKRMNSTSIPPISQANLRKQVLEIFRDIKMKELSEAPQPAFWYGAASLLPLAVPPITFILITYSSALVGFQTTYAATLLSFLGGSKFGYELTTGNMTWNSIRWASTPLFLGWVSLWLPQPLGLFITAGGLLLSAYIDITTVNFPHWYKSLRLALVIPSVFFIFLTFLWRLFH